MKRNSILFLVMILSFSLLLSGCGKSSEELLAEKAIENAFGGDVEVDGESVIMENEHGTWQLGEGASLPSNWPEDVYIPEGKIITSSNTDFSQGVSLEVDKSVSDLEIEYKEKMEEFAWDSTMGFSTDDNVMLGAEKDDRTISVSISSEEGQTTIIITLTSKI